MATRVWQSTVIDAPIGKVWAIVRPLDFTYLPSVQSIQLEGKDTREETVGGERTIYYQDGTEQKVRLLELSDARYELTWEVTSSNPPINYSSVNHTVRLRRITENNTTFVEWTTDFSRDASNEVIEDARYKQKENFKALAAEAAKTFTFKSTADDVAKSQDLKGKVAIVTGASNGIGLETARVLLSRGAHVFAAVRDDKKFKETADKFQQKHPEGKLEILKLDLMSFKSVREAAKAFLDRKLPLHYLILNAGIMAVKKREVTEQKIESQIGVNHVAHHLFTKLLLPAVREAAPSRIVVVSSAANYFGGINFDDINSEKSYDPWKAYAQSKSANILFAKQLQHNLDQETKSSEKKITVFSLHPGVIQTGLAAHLEVDDMKQFEKMHWRRKTIAQGAATTLVAALSKEIENRGGAYLSDCNEAAPSAFCQNMENAQKLWDWTEKIIAAN